MRKMSRFLNLTRYEMKMTLRDPSWLIGLGAAIYIAWNATDFGLGDWPTTNHSLRGFSEGSRIGLVIPIFIISAISAIRDIKTGRRDLIFSRPTGAPLIMGAKFAAMVITAALMTTILMVWSICQPLLFGVFEFHHSKPFIILGITAVAPMLMYAAALGLALGALTARSALAIPLFLGYFIYTMAYAGHNWDRFLWRDFTMETHVGPMGIRLNTYAIGPGDFSFAPYFSPMPGEFLIRSCMYAALSLLIVSLSIGAYAYKRRGTA